MMAQLKFILLAVLTGAGILYYINLDEPKPSSEKHASQAKDVNEKQGPSGEKKAVEKNAMSQSILRSNGLHPTANKIGERLPSIEKKARSEGAKNQSSAGGSERNESASAKKPESLNIALKLEEIEIIEDEGLRNQKKLSFYRELIDRHQDALAEPILAMNILNKFRDEKDSSTALRVFDILVKNGILTGDEEGGCIKENIQRLDVQYAKTAGSTDCFPGPEKPKSDSEVAPKLEAVDKGEGVSEPMMEDGGYDPAEESLDESESDDYIQEGEYQGEF